MEDRELQQALREINGTLAEIRQAISGSELGSRGLAQRVGDLESAHTSITESLNELQAFKGKLVFLVSAIALIPTILDSLPFTAEKLPITIKLDTTHEENKMDGTGKSAVALHAEP